MKIIIGNGCFEFSPMRTPRSSITRITLTTEQQQYKTIGFHTDMTVVNYFDDSDHNQNNAGNHHNAAAAAAESECRSTNSPDRKTDDALLFLNQSHDSEKTLRTATNHCASPSPPAAAVRNARSLLVSPLGMGSPNNSAVSHYYGAEERGDVDYP